MGSTSRYAAGDVRRPGQVVARREQGREGRGVARGGVGRGGCRETRDARGGVRDARELRGVPPVEAEAPPRSRRVRRGGGRARGGARGGRVRRGCFFAPSDELRPSDDESASNDAEAGVLRAHRRPQPLARVVFRRRRREVAPLLSRGRRSAAARGRRRSRDRRKVTARVGSRRGSDPRGRPREHLDVASRTNKHLKKVRRLVEYWRERKPSHFPVKVQVPIVRRFSPSRRDFTLCPRTSARGCCRREARGSPRPTGSSTSRAISRESRSCRR